MTNYLKAFECLGCGKVFPVDYQKYICSDCFENIDAVYDYKGIAEVFSIEKLKTNLRNDVWRYAPLFPFDDLKSVPNLDFTLTPLYRSDFLENETGLNEVYLKDDTRLPSGSFKDRASSVVMAVAKEKGVKVAAAASTGNAGCSWACMGAASGIKVIIYVPKTAPKAKIAQLNVYGADIRIVEGTYDNAYDICVHDSKENNYFNRCTGYNPYTREGKKSVSFEIWEQLGYKTPGAVLVPVGDGNILSGVCKGFRDLKELNLITEMPKLIAVQSSKSDAVAKTFEKIKDIVAFHGKIKIEVVNATTRADSISVDKPRDGLAAVKALLETDGQVVVVEDEEIFSSIGYLASNTGIFVEPAAATSIAGLRKMVKTNNIEKLKGSVVCLLTGNGLKDVDAVLR